MHTALPWVSKAPQPGAAPRHRPPDGMVWNATGGREGPEGYHLFHYKDKDTKSFSHMFDLQEYGVTKKQGLLSSLIG